MTKGWYGPDARYAAQVMKLTDEERARVDDWDGLLRMLADRASTYAPQSKSASGAEKINDFNYLDDSGNEPNGSITPEHEYWRDS